MYYFIDLSNTIEKKAIAVRDFLSRAATSFGNRFYVNFASANFLGGFVSQNAQVLF